jgi:hypothetical protein
MSHGAATALAILAATLVAVGPFEARAQGARQGASDQLWTNAIVDWRVSRPILLELDLESRTQVGSGAAWWAIGATPLVELYPSTWLDVTFEIAVGYARQVPALRSAEVTERAGVRLYPLQMLDVSLPKSRLSVANLARIEQRNFDYFGSEADRLDTHDWRFRDRVELRLGFDLAAPGQPEQLYVVADGEGFGSIGGRLAERFATKVRARAGLGYRRSRSTAFELLLAHDWTRSTVADAFETEARILDVRVKAFF